MNYEQEEKDLKSIFVDDTMADRECEEMLEDDEDNVFQVNSSQVKIYIIFMYI